MLLVCLPHRQNERSQETMHFTGLFGLLAKRSAGLQNKVQERQKARKTNISQDNRMGKER